MDNAALQVVASSTTPGSARVKLLDELLAGIEVSLLPSLLPPFTIRRARHRNRTVSITHL
jgi:hypothetical protein